MSTNKELQEWLKQFPDDTVVKVLTTSTYDYCYSTYTDVYEDEFVPEKFDLKDAYSCYVSSKTFELSVKRQEDDKYGEKEMIVTEIILGKKE